MFVDNSAEIYRKANAESSTQTSRFARDQQTSRFARGGGNRNGSQAKKRRPP